MVTTRAAKRRANKRTLDIALDSLVRSIGGLPKQRLREGTNLKATLTRSHCGIRIPDLTMEPDMFKHMMLLQTANMLEVAKTAPPTAGVEPAPEVVHINDKGASLVHVTWSHLKEE